jgi:hypothetical protein
MPQEIALYKTLSEKVHDVLNAYEPRLVADTTQQKRLLGLLRVPGSINSKSGLPVIANLQAVAGVGVPVFTLAELAEFFKVPSVPQIPRRERALYLSGSGRPVKHPGSCPARRRGRIASADKRLQDLSGIWQHRQGIEQGKRYVSLWYLAEFSKAIGRSLSDTQELVERYAEKCRPPYPSDSDDVPVSEIVKAVWSEPSRCRRFKSASLAKFFDVTPELADELTLQSIIPDATRQARAAAPGPRAQARSTRRDIIKAMLAEHPGRVPSVRQVKARLQGAGSGGSLGVISRDIKAELARFQNKRLKSHKSQ